MPPTLCGAFGGSTVDAEDRQLLIERGVDHDVVLSRSAANGAADSAWRACSGEVKTRDHDEPCHIGHVTEAILPPSIPTKPRDQGRRAPMANPPVANDVQRGRSGSYTRPPPPNAQSRQGRLPSHSGDRDRPSRASSMPGGPASLAPRCEDVGSEIAGELRQEEHRLGRMTSLARGLERDGRTRTRVSVIRTPELLGVGGFGWSPWVCWFW